MAKLEVGALDEYLDMLSKIESSKSEVIIKKSLYEGGKTVADEIKKEINGLAISDNPFKGITADEKKDLKKGFGIAPVQKKDGDFNIKIGFDGYGHKTRSKKFPKGVPIPLTARSIISGTSFRSKNDFVGRATRRVKKKAIEKMDEVINEEFKKEME